MAIVAIDSGDLIRKGKKGSFRACTGVAITIPKIDNFNRTYSEILDKCCNDHGMDRQRKVYKSYDILSSLKFQEGIDFLNDFFDQIIHQISEINFYYTYIFTQRVPMIKIYGAEKSGVEEVKPVEFIKKLSHSYPHCCTWKYVRDHPSEIDGSQLRLDYFEGEVTVGWQAIKELELQIYFAGDEMHPCLAVADMLVKLLDLRLYQQRGALFPRDIQECFSEQKDIVKVNYLGQRYLNYITPIRKQRIDVIPKLARPLIFILKEQPPLQIKDESEMIRRSPLWNKICDFAYDTKGTVKFIDLNNRQDQHLLREGGFAICLGEKGKTTAEYLKNLGLSIEILMASDLMSKEK